MNSNNGKKVCICSAQVPFVRGGNEILVDSLFQELKRRKFEVDLVNIPFKWYPAYEVIDHTLVWRMIDLTETMGEKIDLVIGTKFPSYVVQHPNKVTWLVHQHRGAYDLYNKGLLAPKNDLESAKVKDIVAKIDQESLVESKEIYTISKNVTNRLQQYNNIPSKVLYPPPSLLGRYYTDQYENYILSAGRLDAMKRIDLLISSIPYIDKNIRVKIAGRGAHLEELKKIAHKLNVEDRIDFLGFVTDEELLSLYANAGAVYFAPLDEDYGYITIESFFSQKPIITCTDAGGILEFVEDGKSGYVCSPNPESIANSFNKAFANPSSLEKMGKEGYEIVKNISWDYVIDHLTQTL